MKWISYLAITFDLFEHMTEFNITHKGNGITAFKLTVKLFSRQISHNIITHFQTLKKYGTEDYVDEEFSRLLKYSTYFEILQFSFTTDFEKEPCGLQHELVDLQCDSTQIE
ncbi:hypothetical protein RF11_07536 [Thelohanellus kitauei]|uniref:Uncharacterized protein n=1 Tax=Thelohanellus kitauei TaxID=669202 RepID=A0A0C2I9I3_THEKT|nr:hypothetical protein RF11_07536 [Thelohanellus kitauei]